MNNSPYRFPGTALVPTASQRLRYHYFKAENTYNAIRVMITCYVWMTGFGNFSFFYIKQDFSAIRLLQVGFLICPLIFLQALNYSELTREALKAREFIF